MSFCKDLRWFACSSNTEMMAVCLTCVGALVALQGSGLEAQVLFGVGCGALLFVAASCT